MKRTQTRQACEALLRERFGIAGFRPGQEQAVGTLLDGRDLIALFPTGAGKSLCYQLPALLLPGMTLVVSPLIALMRDQVSHLEALGIPAVCLDSLQAPEAFAAALHRAESGQAKLVYVSPERLETAASQRLAQRQRVSLAVVDEAHCVVQWGESFRPAYTRIRSFLEKLPDRPPVCAMTATLDRGMRRALIGSLGLRRPRVLTLPLIRENLRYAVRSTADPFQEVLRLVREHPGEKGLVFCRTRKGCERMAEQLCREGFRAAFYHAGMEREERAEEQERFAAGETDVLACTSAFGMGVDIPDIRFVLHTSLPDCITDYAQQSGRAGRDGQPSDCMLLLDPADLVRKNLHFNAAQQEVRRISLFFPVRRLKAWRKLRRDSREAQAVLRLALDGGCIPRGLARAFGQRVPPCGQCSACLRSAAMGSRVPLAPVPDLTARGGVDIRLWALRWQRDALAAREGLPPEQVMGEAAMEKVAWTGKLLPEDCSPSAFRPMQRLVLRMESREDPASAGR